MSDTARDPRGLTSLDTFLDEEGIREEVAETAKQRVEQDRFNLPPHVQRLYIEADELNDRLKKLGTFIANNELFTKLSTQEQELLQIQSSVMATYAQILLARLTLAMKHVS